MNVAQMRTASWSKALIHERARCTASSLEANSRLAAPAMAEGSSRTSVVVSSQRRASALSTRETRDRRQGTPATVERGFPRVGGTYDSEWRAGDDGQETNNVFLTNGVSGGSCYPLEPARWSSSTGMRSRGLDDG